MGARVLVIDDEPEIRQVLRIGLAARGYVVETAAGGSEGLERLQRGATDVVVLDLMLPDLPGAEVIRQIRAWCAVPVIILSVRDEEQEKVRVLDLGADDYLTKPFGMDELVARIKVALRHAGGTDLTKPVFRTGELAVDFERRQVLVAGHEVTVTPTEYSILKVLAQHAGKVLTHRMLLQAVWGPTYGTETNYLHVYVRRLRRKLERDPLNPKYLVTEPGAGYRLHLE